MNVFRRLETLIGKNSSNLSQIARRVNITKMIYIDHFEDLKKENDEISREIMRI